MTKVDEINYDLENNNCTIKVHDPSGFANLILWQDQMFFSKLIQVGDLLLINCPFIESRQENQDLIIECGSQTELSVLPRDLQDVKLEKRNTKRTTISELSKRTTGTVSLYGRIIFQKVIEGSGPGSLIFGIRIQDETGSIDITITNESLGLKAIRSDLGNFVFLTDLDTVIFGDLVVLEATKLSKFVDGSLQCLL